MTYHSDSAPSRQRTATEICHERDKEYAQQLLNHLAPDQITAVVHVMKVMLDPLSRKLATAPIENEEISPEEEEAVSEAREWLKHNELIPYEEVLAEFGLTMADFERTAGAQRVPNVSNH